MLLHSAKVWFGGSDFGIVWPHSFEITHGDYNFRMLFVYDSSLVLKPNTYFQHDGGTKIKISK